MNKIVRRRFLEKLAAKTEKPEKLKGKNNRKSVEKFLDKLKKQYSSLSGALKDAKTQLEKLQTFIDEHKENESLTRAEMKKAHDILRNMDFSGADEVNIGSDEDDVAYIKDGKRYSYNSDTNDLCRYEKKTKKEIEDVNDASELSEGFDVNIGAN